MQIQSLIPPFRELQKIHGSASLDAVFGGGKTDNPDVCLVFMNPTARNVSSRKDWNGLKAPWIGTKHVWAMLADIGLFPEETNRAIQSKSPWDWTEEFANEVYGEVSRKSLYVTNLSKATQDDARPLPDRVFREYLELFYEEILEVDPKIIVTFWNQVSSVLLGESVKVSSERKKSKILDIEGKRFPVFPVYYPVWQGRRNIAMAREDIGWILENELLRRTNETL